MTDQPISDQPSLRAALRSHTAELHQKLDERVGDFADAEQYAQFVMRSLRFRLIAEPACDGTALWSPMFLTDALRQDAKALNLQEIPAAQHVLFFSTPSEKLGALYVLEGSALGARLLLRRAQALGFTETSGALHLSLQTSDNRRWKAFLEVLDTQGLDHAAALKAAHQLFDVALAIYSEAAHEYA